MKDCAKAQVLNTMGIWIIDTQILKTLAYSTLLVSGIRMALLT